MNRDRRTTHLKVGQPDGDGVCRVGFRRFGETEQRTNHISNLRFLRCTVTDDRLFHPSWRVFVDGHPMLRSRQKRRSTRSSEDHRGPQVLDVDQSFDRTCFRGMEPNQLVDLSMDLQ